MKLLDKQTWDQIENQVLKQVSTQIWLSVRIRVTEEVCFQVEHQVWRHIKFNYSPDSNLN